MRGGTFQQVLLIIDGVRMNDPNTGHFTAYIPVAAAEIERIEILKGASSALYGSDAVGGVIHIITKTFAAKKEARNKNALVRFTAGEYRTYIADAGFFRNTGETAFGLSGQLINTRGQLQRGTRGFVESSNLNASFSHYIGSWQVALRTAYDRRKFAAQNFYTSFLSDTAEETITTFWNALQLTHTADKNVFRLQAGYKNLKDSFSFNPRTPTNQNKSTLFQILATNEHRLSSAATIVGGGQVMAKKIISNDRGNHTVNSIAAFAVLNARFAEWFFISPALRLEWNEISKTEVIPQLNLSYRTSKFNLRGSVGKTIRDADFTERYNNYNKAFVASGRIGNPDLDPERSFSYEIGTDYRPAGSIKISSTFFKRRHIALIDYVNTPYAEMPRRANLSPAGLYALAKNIAEVITSGFETDAQFAKKTNNGAAFATLGLVWLNSESSNQTPSLYVSSHAKFLTNFNLIYNRKSVTISINGLYKTRQSQTAASLLLAKLTRDYFLLNTKADVYIGKGISAFLEVDNITDRSYTDLLGSQMPGRWLMAGIKFASSK
jgi:iron complex outermembrane receptor protein